MIEVRQEGQLVDGEMITKHLGNERPAAYENATDMLGRSAVFAPDPVPGPGPNEPPPPEPMPDPDPDEPNE